jgi:transcriptional regulator with XRE-family HTH domain
LHIHGIKEMPAGYDAEVAELFRDLRSATTLSESDLAMRLGTRPDVVQALEQGALFALPPWAETCRVVNAYGAMLNLDVRPLLRRIYAQLEAGIVELQPKPMPDVPVMAPPDTRDHGFAAGNHEAGAHAPNPLDIPWPPQQSPQPQNARPQPQPGGAPQAPRPNLQGAPQPQWPGGAPQSQPQVWPGNQTMPQAAQPGAPPQRQQPQPQPQPQLDVRGPHPHPHAHPHQAAAPQAHPQFQPQPQSQPQARRAPPPQPQLQIEPEARPLEDFAVEPVLMEPEPEKKRRRPGLLKWGLGALIVSVVAFGLWFALNQAPSPSGASTGQSGTLDPDDPRSRKADKLPTPPGG